ncbi:MAG TPA: ABC transporter ATP-binding protein [Oscillospiraceae bacterium]|nr:ABC transporter ATP-binding protein [Oscillospiraceae bacterium]
MHKLVQQPPLVQATEVGIKYKAGRKREDFKSLFLGNSGQLGDFWALREISFSAAAADIIGIIGSNGAGKTTLCRVISRLLRPDLGTIRVNGEVSALLSLGTGFNQELTGRENIFLNGMMLGFSRRHMEEISQDIVDFAGLQDFIDQPIKSYSSGMRARLGFSIATMLEPEILVLDEALSTGDAEFNQRAMARTTEMVSKAKVVLIVSHDINFIAENCTKAIWIDQGRLMAEGDPLEVCEQYRQMVQTSGLKQAPKKRKLRLQKTTSKTGEETVIAAQDLGLCYKMPERDFWALRHCNFTVQQGEIVGIIGPNGAGKSTLCSILSGILKPDEGTLETKGDVSALLSFGSGFNKQLSGHDNIYLNALMLGMSKKKVDAVYQDIVDFSGLEKFIENPIKSYSSGMVSRLGFSIATMLEPDIFIIDEALATGDLTFYEKASARIQEMINTAKAVMIVTHSMSFVQKVCTKAIWLKKGQVMHIGDPEETIALYEADTAQVMAARAAQQQQRLSS